MSPTWKGSACSQVIGAPQFLGRVGRDSGTQATMKRTSSNATQVERRTTEISPREKLLQKALEIFEKIAKGCPYSQTRKILALTHHMSLQCKLQGLATQ